LDRVRFALPALSVALVAASLAAEGLPVKSDLVRARCGACHQVDSEQRMSRISFVRKTPEGWEETIQRMMRLHGLDLTPADGRKIEQYLSDSHGLTASELEQVSYSLSNEDVEERIPNEAVKSACTTCHSYAKIAGQRRTRQEWLNLKDFLLAMFPTLVYQHRFEDWPALCDKALPWLAEEFPLETSEWKRERGQRPPAEGRWLVRGHQLGKGDYVGAITFRGAADGGFETEAIRLFADGGSASMNGRGQWLGASAWRGSSHGSDIDRAREVFQLSADGKTQNGRLFPFQHPEQGANEVRYQVDGSVQISGVMPSVLRRGASAVALHIYGANLNPSLAARDVKLGSGIIVDKVTQTVTQTVPDHLDILVHVAPGAEIGRRDIQVGVAHVAAALTVYDQVDYIRALPEKSLARLGGVRAVPRFIQFEAHAFSNGPDGIPGNSDDLDLGFVKASWTLAESFNAPNDEDVKYVGSIDQNGLFTPGQEGPNPQRQRSTNNAGDVWVNASYTPEGSSAPLKTRAYLLVSVPQYRELISQ
jgi:quinohemoprotein amine dehydrogenase